MNDEDKKKAIVVGAVLTPPKGALRVWWMPQVPGSYFIQAVGNLREAYLLTTALARYDLFLYTRDIRKDFSNAGGVEVWDGTEWAAWEDKETGMDFDEWVVGHTEITGSPYETPAPGRE